MPAPGGNCASKRDNKLETTVLVLTDGSNQAKRVAEWGLIFADVARATVHRIDVVDCLDSGMIIYRYKESGQNKCTYPERQPTGTSTDETNQIHRHEHAIDVLHGVPHKALLDYVDVNAIDLIIIGTYDRSCCTHSFIEDTLITVSQTATTPVITLGGRN